MAVVEIAGGRRVHYDEAGSGPPLLLISGLGSSRGSWVETMEALAPHFRVIAHDNRDTGEADPEADPYSIADMADDAAGLLRALGIDRAHVMGISMGGFIAQQLALRHPDLVDHLILVATSPAAGAAVGRPLAVPDPSAWIVDPVERARQTLPTRVAPGFFERNPGRLEEMAQQARGNRVTLDGYARQTMAISDTHDVRERLGEISVPTLVIHGDLDPLVPLVGGQALAAGIPNARLIVYEGVGHLPPRERPEQFHGDVLRFLTP